MKDRISRGLTECTLVPYRGHLLVSAPKTGAQLDE